MEVEENFSSLSIEDRLNHKVSDIISCIYTILSYGKQDFVRMRNLQNYFGIALTPRRRSLETISTT